MSSNNSATQKEAREKGRNLRPLRQLVPYLARRPKMLLAALVSLIVASAATLLVPTALRRVIDNGFSAQNADTIDQYFLAMIGVVLLISLASASRYYFVTSLGERVVADLRSDVFRKVLYLDATYLDKTQTGEIVSRLTADTTQIKSAVGSVASLALRNLFLFAGAALMMVITSPRLSSLVLVAIPLIVVPLVAIGRLVRKRARTAQDKLAEASAFATEMVGAVREVQAFTAGNRTEALFSRAVTASFTAARSSIFIRSILTAILIFIVFSSVVGILWFGATAVIEGDMSPGTLSQFLLYAVFAAGALGALSEVWGELQQTAGATERLMELISEVPAIKAPNEVKAIEAGNIKFDSVRFSYDTGDRPILKSLNLEVKTGETVALVGPSGGGKSTVFSLLMRFYDAKEGNVTIGDTDIRNTDPEELRKLFALVPQEPAIFAASISDNIGFGAECPTQEQVRAAAKAAFADDFISQTENGYETLVGERGMTLSGGQRQRLAIARAILRDAPILLLDEATSALDAESEAMVQQALSGLMEGRTTLVIAHRLATILNADRILLIDNGEIVEEGTHESLLKEGGLYAKLAKLQFETGQLALRAAE